MSVDSITHKIIAGRSGRIAPPISLSIIDAVTMACLFGAGGFVNFSYDNLNIQRFIILLLLILFCVTVFNFLGHYNRRRPFWQEIGDIVGVAVLALIIDAALLYLLKVNFSRVWVVTSWTAIIICLPMMRMLAKQVFVHLGTWKQPTVVIGTSASAIEAAHQFAVSNHLGYDIVAFLDPCGNRKGLEHLDVCGRDVPVEGIDPSKDELPAWLGHPHVIVALELDEMAGRETLIENLSLHHGDIDIVSPLRGLPINRTRVTHFFSSEILSLRIYNNLARPWPRMLKRCFDLIIASLLLLALSPLMAFIAWRVARSGGPVLFAHERVGRHGRLFKCYKFRTMITDAANVLAKLLAENPSARAEWEQDFKLRNDPRITSIGHWLRRTSFDEMPQLFNVLAGDMSLVGPRPVVRDELARYGDGQVYYLQVRPGLTGIWQASGRNDVDYSRRVNLDTWYVRNWNLWYDIVILAKTFWAVVIRRGAY
ncbi:MAG: undecaprenyl-phosphate galactose phosphotransferase WbaP [Cyanobacteria bacterium J06638_22]